MTVFNAVVLDASALLAFVLAEPGGERVIAALSSDARTVLHLVNWTEVMTRMANLGTPPQALETLLTQRGLLHQSLRLEPGTPEDARRAAELRALTRHAGLSLGDRCCLALGQRLGARVLTADRAWGQVQLPGVQIELIR